MTHKISLIGAGSAVFSLNIVRDICLTPSMQGGTVSLMDIDPERLESVYRLCTRYADEVGVVLDIQQTTDRHDSLEGADFVVNTALTAGYDRLRDGWEIARRHGYRDGGSLHLMHDEAFWINFYQLRFFEDLAVDILAICPRAWYLQVANPIFAGSTLLGRRHPEVRFVGLCHGFSGIYQIVEALGLERERVTYEIPGVNHFVWLNRFTYEGKDAFPLLDRWIEAHGEDPAVCVGELSPKKIDLYRRLGAYPIGDTGSVGGGAWPWWYHVDPATERHYQEDPVSWWEGHMRRGPEWVAEMQRVTADASVRLTEMFKPEKSGELVVPMIESIACDVPRVMVGNVPNRGRLVPGVPEDLTVEVPLLVSGCGVRGIQTAPLPAGVLSYLLRDYAAPVDIELAAYLEGSRKLLLELIMQDPWTRSMEQAERMLDEVLALPYHAEMREHYR